MVSSSTDLDQSGLIGDPEVVVVIVSFNPGEHLQRCVAALEAQTSKGWEAIVWDNASSDGAAARLNAGPRVRVILHQENVGFAAANNRAASLSKARYIVTLNPDAFPEPTWLEHLLATAEAFGASAVGSLQLDDADPSRLDGAGDCMSIAGIAWRGGFGHSIAKAPQATAEIFAPCAAAALYRRVDFEREGGFDERFFCYYEDVDLGFRLRLSGGRCLIEPKAIVRHVGSATTRSISGFAEFHGTRNRLWTFLRNMPLLLIPVALPAHVLLTAFVVLRSPSLRKVRLRALKHALLGACEFLKDRKRGRIDLGNVTRLITWSPIALSRRDVKARVIRRET